jgi:tetratricopeptide (TPR) repeat protein
MRRKVLPTTPPVPIEDLGREAQAQGNEPGPAMRYGWALYGAGRIQEARQVLEAASQRHPNDLETLYALALTLKRAGESNLAVKALKRIADLIPSITDRTRSAVLRRITHGHLNMLERGQWDLEKEIWGRAEG